MSMPSTTETVNPELGIPSYLDVFEQVGGSGGHAELQGVLRRLVARARALRELRPGWDSYGAAAPSAQTLHFALLFAAQTCVFLVQGGTPRRRWTGKPCFPAPIQPWHAGPAMV
jgi:hypothetical protein